MKGRYEMGACDISFTVDGKKTFSEVQRVFKARQGEDELENGHASGYSGDFQTVHMVVDHSHKVFNSQGDAMEYCLATAKKWETVVAVKYKVMGKVSYPKRIDTLKKRLEAASKKLEAFNGGLVAKAQARVKAKAFIKCGHCKSKVATAFLLNDTFNCPVCKLSFLTATERKRLNNYKKVVQLYQDGITIETNKAYEKAAEKSNDTKWLVAGWGAC